MPRLFILDQSIRDVGGHHFHQAALIAEAARRRGLEPIVAANRNVVRRDWPVPCELVPQFPNTSYNGCSATVSSGDRLLINPFRASKRGAAAVAVSGADGSRTEQSGQSRSLVARLLQFVRERRLQKRCRRLAVGLARSMEQLFERFPLTADDWVFVPTITEFDLVGLVEFLAHHPEAQRARWGMVFHFPLVRGPWTGDAGQLARMEVMRSHFKELADRVPHVNWRFYGSTPLIVEQYQRLGVAPVELAHPPVHVDRPVQVAPLDAAPEPSRDRNESLRVLCAGALRGPKLSNLLQHLIGELERDDFASGRIQLWVQADLRRRLVRRSGGRNWVTVDPLGPPPDGNVRLVHIPYPLPTATYAKLLQSADIGLLGYSAIRYAAMQSGVMSEFLATGVPVVVTDQTWMARELVAVAGGADQASGRTASTPAEFADALRAIAIDIDLYRAHATRIAPAYAAQNSADALLDIITRPR